MRKISLTEIDDTIRENRKWANDTIRKKNSSSVRRKKARTRTQSEIIALNEISLTRWKKAVETGKVKRLGEKGVYIMITIDDLRKEFNALQDKPKFQKQLEFSGLLTEYVKYKGIKPIIVGGLSVEIYTRNDYHTHDIDFVSDGWNLFNEVLTELGFNQLQREWYHTDAEIAIEIPSNHLEGSLEHIYEITLPSKRTIYVIGVEDIIIHRIEGIAFTLKYPKEDEDYEWAYRMFLIHKENLDMNYFTKQAKKLNIFHVIEEWFE